MGRAMDLVDIFRRVRRAVRRGVAPASAVAIVLQLSRGGFTVTGARTLDVLLVLAAVAAMAVRLQVRPRVASEATVAPMDAGVALVSVSIGYVLVALAGGTHGPLGGLPLIVIAVAAAMVPPRGAIGVVACALANEAAMHYAAVGVSDPSSLGLRCALVVASAAMHHGLTRAEILRVQSHARRMIRDEHTRQKEAAQSFRLVSASAEHSPRRSDRDEDTRVRASLDEIHASIVGLLVLTRRTMALRTCALFWIDARGSSLRLVEAATDDAAGVELRQDPLPLGAGVLGGAVSLARPVVLAHLRPEYAGLTYYKSSRGIKAVAAVPVMEGTTVRGVLVADRGDDHGFDTDEQATLETVALQARRLVENERIFARLERARDDMARLFEASRTLGEALTEEQVIAAVVSSAKGIVDHDVLVLAGYEAKSHEHRVRHVDGEGVPTGLQNLVFGDNAGIASAVVKTRHALPYRGQFDPKSQYVFTKELPLAGCTAVLTLPLVVRDRVMGTLTLASHRRHGFAEGSRQLLGVLAAHASVALSNAAAVRRLEEMATTDPMTGLLNKRALEIEFEQRLRAAARFGHVLSLIVLDIDHFKAVNDTYGHAVGDVVIKGVGAVLGRCRRETDVVARFGGEEFVVLCQETDTDGALLLAERIREDLARQTFLSEIGMLRVTCSLGVAEFPRHAADRTDLFARADEALYEAKHHGRNQSRVAVTRMAPAQKPPHKPSRSARAAVTS